MSHEPGCATRSTELPFHLAPVGWGPSSARTTPPRRGGGASSRAVRRCDPMPAVFRRASSSGGLRRVPHVDTVFEGDRWLPGYAELRARPRRGHRWLRHAAVSASPPSISTSSPATGTPPASSPLGCVSARAAHGWVAQFVTLAIADKLSRSSGRPRVCDVRPGDAARAGCGVAARRFSPQPTRRRWPRSTFAPRAVERSGLRGRTPRVVHREPAPRPALVQTRVVQARPSGRPRNGPRAGVTRALGCCSTSDGRRIPSDLVLSHRHF